MSVLMTILLIYLFPVTPVESESYQLTDFDITVSGTSSLHDWTSDVEEAFASADASWSEGKLTNFPALQLRIPVASITSTKGKIMDKKTWNALREEEYPNISFSLKSTTITPDGEQYRIKAKGSLAIAGQTHPIDLTATASGEHKNVLRISGAHTLKMTDFGIEPPKALLGTLKTGNEVTINFDITLNPTSVDQR